MADPTPMPDEELVAALTAICAPLGVEPDDPWQAKAYWRNIAIGYRNVAKAVVEGRSCLATRARPEPQPMNREEVATLREALRLAEDVLSRFPFTGEIWPDGTHPNRGITTIREALTLASRTEGQTCERCQGNGEIIIDWNEYLNPPDGAPADAGTETCPDCGGRDDALPNPHAPAEPEPQPVGSTPGRREEIARIVDHEGYWERLDNLNAVIRAGLASDDQHMELCHVRDEEIAGTADSLSKADQIMALPSEGEAWRWLAERVSLSLEFGYPDDEGEPGRWQVHRVSGNVNDREWELVGEGETPLAAVAAARAAEALARADQHIGREVG